MVTTGQSKIIYINQDICIGQYELITTILDMLEVMVSSNLQTGNESF